MNDEEPIFSPNFDIHALLEERLNYIWKFYDYVAKPLEERKYQIANNLAPYVDSRNPEEADGPDFELAWQEAEEYLRTVGFSCLTLLAKTLENFVRMFLMRELRLTTVKELNKALSGISKKKDGKIPHFLRGLGDITHSRFAWNNSPVPKEALEDLVVTRNAFIHDEQLEDRIILQQSAYFSRSSHSIFSDLRWAEVFGNEEVWDRPQKLHVTRSNLHEAFQEVRRFADYLESCRTTW